MNGCTSELVAAAGIGAAVRLLHTEGDKTMSNRTIEHWCSWKATHSASDKGTLQSNQAISRRMLACCRCSVAAALRAAFSDDDDEENDEELLPPVHIAKQQGIVGTNSLPTFQCYGPDLPRIQTRRRRAQLETLSQESSTNLRANAQFLVAKNASKQHACIRELKPYRVRGLEDCLGLADAAIPLAAICCNAKNNQKQLSSGMLQK